MVIDNLPHSLSALTLPILLSYRLGTTLTVIKQANVRETHLFVLYDYNSNTIDAGPIPNQLGLTIKRARQKLLAKLHAKGIQTKLYTLENEASRFLRDFLTSEGVIP